MNLKNFVCNIGEDAELLMSLYDPDQSEFIRLACFVFFLLTRQLNKFDSLRSSMPLKVYRNVHNVYIIDQKTFKEVLMARNTTTAKVKN